MRANAINLKKVAILGASGGIGQPLSLLMKMNKYVTELHLYDMKGAPGVAMDLSHISSPCKVIGYGVEDLSKAVKDVDLVLIPAGVPRKPGMNRSDLFTINSSIARDLALAVGKNSPKAVIGVISNPINSTVPIASAALKKAGMYNPHKLFGITTLDIVRSRTFVSEVLGKRPDELDIAVIGGHSGGTIVPLLSSYTQLTEKQVSDITHRIQYGGDEVVKAKQGAGSATLSMAFAGEQWANTILRALSGEKGVTMCSFVESNIHPRCLFFSSPVELNEEGLKAILPLPKLNKYEEGLLEKCVVELESSIKEGIDFANQ